MNEFTRTIDRVKEELKDNFIIRAESSATALGLANTKGLPLKVYTPMKINIPNVEAEVVRNIETYFKSVVSLLDRVSCTNAETTIIEMLKEDADPQTIVESMCHYFFSIQDETWGILPELAKEAGVLGEFLRYTDDAIEQAYH